MNVQSSGAESYSVFAVDSIKTATEKVEYHYDNATSNNKISSIRIYDLSNAELTKQIDFFYSTLNVNPTHYAFLDSAKIWDRSKDESEVYVFNYYGENDYAPGYLSNGILLPDFWGLNKVVPDYNRLLDIRLGDDHVRESGSLHNTIRSGQFDKIGYVYNGYITDRKVNLTPELFTLKTISYPMGGYTKYTFESNVINEQEKWGGLRVKSIQHFDNKTNSSVPTLKRGYLYEKGIPAYAISHNDFRKEHLNLGISGTAQAVRRRAVVYSSNTLGDAPASPEIYYGRVIERQLGVGGTDNGSIVFD